MNDNTLFNYFDIYKDGAKELKEFEELNIEIEKLQQLAKKNIILLSKN